MDAREIETSKLVPNGANPRRKLGDVTELAASIVESGILQPLLVRQTADGFEVIAGSRRLAAAKLANLETVPCVVTGLDDDGAATAALIENLQREALPPLDEGEALARLVDAGLTIAQVAHQIGRPDAYVARRRQLAELHPDVKKAVADSGISLGVALQIARLPKDQHVEAMTVVHGLTEEGARGAIERTFLLRLADAPFSRTDAGLHPKAGACSKCPKRTGAQPNLFGDVAKDVCSDRACYQVKVEKGWEAKVARYKEEGHIVVEDEAAARKLMGFGERPTSASGFVSSDDLADGEKTWKQLVDEKWKGDAPIEIALVRSASGRHVELYRRRDVASLVPKPEKVASAPASPKEPSPKKAAKVARETTAALLAGIQKRCAKDGVELAGWRTLLRVAIEELGYAALSDERIEELGEVVDSGALFELHAGLAEVVLAYACERLKGAVHPELERFAEVHGVAEARDEPGA